MTITANPTHIQNLRPGVLNPWAMAWCRAAAGRLPICSTVGCYTRSGHGPADHGPAEPGEVAVAPSAVPTAAAVWPTPPPTWGVGISLPVFWPEISTMVGCNYWTAVCQAMA